MKSINSRHQYLTTLAVAIASFTTYTAVAVDANSPKNSSLDQSQAACINNISAKDNKIEISNCGDIDLNLKTQNGSEITIESNGKGNAIVVETSPDGKASITQSGNQNSVTITQLNGSSSTGKESVEEKFLRMREHHKRHMERRRELRNRANNNRKH